GDGAGTGGVPRSRPRAWRAVDEPKIVEGDADPNQRKRHATIKHVGERIETNKFNTAVAALMEYVTALIAGATREDLETLTKLLSPFAPHLAEAMWERLGHEPLVCTPQGAAYDPALVVSETVTVAVQVNGKLRGTFEVPLGTPDEELKRRALEHPNVAKHIEGKPVKRIIVVGGKLVNIVV